MAYTINLTNGTALTTIADGTVNDTSTSLVLIGKNYSNYGTYLNDNFVHLLENASNDTPPTTPLTGQLWWDTSGNLNVYTGSQFVNLAAITSSTSQPSSPRTGNQWWDTTNQQFNVYNGSTWTLIGPAFTSNGGTILSETILDNSSNPHSVLAVNVGTTRIGIISKDTAFTPLSLTGFSSIKPGFNLVSTGTLPGVAYWGTASDASTLGNVVAASYARTDTAVTFSDTVTINNNSGLTVGTSNNFIASVSGSAVYLTQNVSNADLAIRANLGGTVANAMVINGANGTATFSSNIVTSGYLVGTAVQSWYADLAERFEADEVYGPGTVLEIGGEKEVTLANEELSENVFGVVSTNAGYLMNAGAGTDKTHPAVAVNGRVPVNVIGKVKKGDRLVSAGNGYARVGKKGELSSFNVIGRSLENKDTDGAGSVLAIVKLNS